MRTTLFSVVLVLTIFSCSRNEKPKELTNIYPDNLSAMLDSVWVSEQNPIRKRDSLIDIYGVDAEAVDKYQKIYRENHSVNIVKIRNLLDNYGWPDTTLIDYQGRRTICNVLQHDTQKIRELYIPMMKQAVLDNKLEPAFLVRAEDRLATDRGELQIYGGQMKYYPDTKSFNVWPVYDPINIDKRRAEIGLGPIDEFLKARFDFEWDLEEQIKRTEEFEKARIEKGQ